MIICLSTASTSPKPRRLIRFSSTCRVAGESRSVPLAHLTFPYSTALHISQSEGSHSDCWSFEEAIDFYRRAETIDRSLGLSGRVVHETHRKRCLFHPQLTARLVKALPNLRLTGDISHWTVVCERMLDITEVDKAAMDIVIPPVRTLQPSAPQLAAKLRNLR